MTFYCLVYGNKLPAITNTLRLTHKESGDGQREHDVVPLHFPSSFFAFPARQSWRLHPFLHLFSQGIHPDAQLRHFFIHTGL